MGSITARWKVDKAEFRELMQEAVKTGASLGEAGIMALLVEIREGLEEQRALLARLVDLAEGDYADDEERLPRSLGER